MSETRLERLADLCEIVVGRTPSRSEPAFWGQGHPWVSIADMNQGLLISKTKEELTDLGAEKGKLIPQGTVLLSFKLSIGKVSIAGMPLYTNEAIAALIIKDPDALDSRYLMWTLKSMDLSTGSNRAAMGATLNKAKLNEIRIPVPSLEEQKSKAQIEDIQALIEQKRERQQELLKEFQIALFHKMFSGKDWPLKPLGEVATVVSGATPKTSKEEFWGGEIQWVTPAELSKLDSIYIDRTERTITAEGLDSCAAQVLPVGSVLLSSRAPIGLVAINTVPMATNQGFKSLIPGPELDSLYLYFWLKINTPYLQSLGVGATFKELSKSTLSKIKLPIPPKTLQQEFKTIINHFDSSEK